MSTRTLVAAVAVLALLCGPRASSADPIIDQLYAPPLTNHGRLEGHNQFAQTFTVGLSGLMTGLDLPIARDTATPGTGDLVISILPTISGAPASDLGLALTSVAVPSTYWVTSSVAGSWGTTARHVELTSPFMVSVGSVLAVVVRLESSSTSPLLYWYGSNDQNVGTYLPGQRFDQLESEFQWTAFPRQDFGFATYVDPDVHAVPEPGSTLLLLGTGLASLVAARRLRSLNR